MKTTKDFIGEFENYSAEIEKEIVNLNRMREEFNLNCKAGRRIMEDLVPVLKKLHLEVDNFTIFRPNEKMSCERGSLNLNLVSDGGFKFIKHQGYNVRGENKNESRLFKKMDKICGAVVSALSNERNELRCTVNPFSLQVRQEEEEGGGCSYDPLL